MRRDFQGAKTGEHRAGNNQRETQTTSGRFNTPGKTAEQNQTLEEAKLNIKPTTPKTIKAKQEVTKHDGQKADRAPQTKHGLKMGNTRNPCSNNHNQAQNLRVQTAATTLGHKPVQALFAFKSELMFLPPGRNISSG